MRWEDSNQTAHQPGATFTMPVASVTMYAKWSINSYAFSYNANGGTGSLPSSQNIDFASSVTVTNTQVTRDGYTFSRWNTAADGSGTSYDANATFQMPSRAVTLYAQWNVIVTTTTTSTTTIPAPPVTVAKKPSTSKPIVTTTTTTTTTLPPTTTTSIPVVDDVTQSESGNTWMWWAAGVAVLSLAALALSRKLKRKL